MIAPRRARERLLLKLVAQSGSFGEARSQMLREYRAMDQDKSGFLSTEDVVRVLQDVGMGGTSKDDVLRIILSFCDDDITPRTLEDIDATTNSSCSGNLPDIASAIRFVPAQQGRAEDEYEVSYVGFLDCLQQQEKKAKTRQGRQKNHERQQHHLHRLLRPRRRGRPALIRQRGLGCIKPSNKGPWEHGGEEYTATTAPPSPASDLPLNGQTETLERESLMQVVESRLSGIIGRIQQQQPTVEGSDKERHEVVSELLELRDLLGQLQQPFPTGKQEMMMIQERQEPPAQQQQRQQQVSVHEDRTHEIIPGAKRGDLALLQALHAVGDDNGGVVDASPAPSQERLATRVAEGQGDANSTSEKGCLADGQGARARRPPVYDLKVAVDGGFGRNALYYACLCGHARVVEWMVAEVYGGRENVPEDELWECHKNALNGEVKRALQGGGEGRRGETAQGRRQIETETETALAAGGGKDDGDNGGDNEPYDLSAFWGGWEDEGPE